MLRCVNGLVTIMGNWSSILLETPRENLWKHSHTVLPDNEEGGWSIYPLTSHWSQMTIEEFQVISVQQSELPSLAPPTIKFIASTTTITTNPAAPKFSHPIVLLPVLSSGLSLKEKQSAVISLSTMNFGKKELQCFVSSPFQPIQSTQIAFSHHRLIPKQGTGKRERARKQSDFLE